MTKARPSQLLAALDSLDLSEAQTVRGTTERTALESKEEKKKSSIQRLGLDGKSEDTFRTFLRIPSDSVTTLKEPPRQRLYTKPVKRAKGATTATVISLEAEEAPVSPTSLPIYSYKDYTPASCVVYTRNEEEIDDLVESLKPGTVAMDLEWRVGYFRKHGTNTSVQRERKVAVVQIVDNAGLILVIQINEMRRFPSRLQALIEDPVIAKVGVNILNDGKKLFRDYGILARNLVELGSVALVVDPSPVAKRKIVSLAKLVEHYCRKTLMKGVERTSDWEKLLTKKQQEYAANDAHSSLMVFNELLKLSRTHSCTLDGSVQSQFTNEVTWPSGTSILAGIESSEEGEEGMRPQYLRAYEYWHQKKLSLDEMCLKLSLKNKGYYGSIPKEGNMALKPGTVISYIISALKNRPELEFQPTEIIRLVQMDINSWSRHSSWIVKQLSL